MKTDDWDAFLEQYATVCNERDNLKLEIEHIKAELEELTKDGKSVSDSKSRNEDRAGK